MIYSDLDGTFLDANTYSFEASLPALRAALGSGAAVVFCSSKTRAEIEALLARLGLRQAFVAENGGGVYIPEGYFSRAVPLEARPVKGGRILALGTPYPELVRALQEVSRQLGYRVRGFAGMSVDEVAAVCDLGPQDAALAKEREFDEPFVVEGPCDLERMREAFSRRGLQVTRGGRFHHLTGRNDKGAAVLRLQDLFRMEGRKVCSIGIGDSANDLPMLAAVETPVLVQKPGGTYDESVLRSLPAVRRARGVGPHGWAEAISRLLAGARKRTATGGGSETTPR